MIERGSDRNLQTQESLMEMGLAVGRNIRCLMLYCRRDSLSGGHSTYHTQRRRYKLIIDSKKSAMNSEKVAALDSIDFFWNAKQKDGVG